MPTWRNIPATPNIRKLVDTRDKTTYAIQSQYSASKTITALTAEFQNLLDPNEDIDLFYDRMFNILSAEGVGLDNWGVILGIGRNIEGPPVRDGSSEQPSLITLDDDHYRLLLLYKALANISAATAAAQNELLATLINTGIGGFPKTAYVLEVDTMVIRWVFEADLDDIQFAVFKAAGTLARGAGVGWEIYAVDPDKVLGFDGAELHPFNQAPFAPDNALISRRR